MMLQLRFIFLLSSLLVVISAAGTKNADTATLVDSNTALKQNSVTLDAQTTAQKLNAIDEESREEHSFETAHKIQDNEQDFHTSHRIPAEALRQHELHQNMKSQEKPELNLALSELIAEDIKKNIQAKLLAENEEKMYSETITFAPDVLLTTQKPTKAVTEDAMSINEGLVDDSSILEEAGSENKQTSRIQIKKGPNGQDYEYEYVYYYYDDDESKNPEDDDIIVANKKTAITPPPGKSRYNNIERGSSTSAPEINEITQTRGKARNSNIPAPVEETLQEDRLPPSTRFPQRNQLRSEKASEKIIEKEAPETGKRYNVKRPSLELVDSHSFVTDEKDKVSNRPRIIESEQTKSEHYETISKSSLEYNEASTTVSSILQSDSTEETTPLMEKLAIDLYAILQNENANEDDKKARLESSNEITTVSGEDDSTVRDNPRGCDEDDECKPIASSTSTTSKPVPTTTTTTTPKTTTTSEAPSTTTTEAPKGRGSLTAGRNRFRFQKNDSATSTDTSSSNAATGTEAPKKNGRFQRPNTYGSRNAVGSSARSTEAPAAAEVKETASKDAVPTVGSKINARTRNRFNLRGPSQPVTTTEGSNSESTTSRLLRARPQFSVRGRGGKPGVSSTTAASDTLNDENEEVSEPAEEKPVAKPALTRPTTRLNLNRPTNRLLPGQKARTSPLASAKKNEEEAEKSAAEAESDSETTTQSNLNKLKSRPRIQINDKKKVPSSNPVLANRKVNPLLKRKFGPSTPDPATETEDKSGEVETSDIVTKDGAKEESENQKTEDEDTTDIPVEASSEQPRGLGLLSNRRKLAARRPGTIL